MFYYKHTFNNLTGNTLKFSSDIPSATDILLFAIAISRYLDLHDKKSDPA